MNTENTITHGFRLRIAGETEPTIFFWPIIPDSVDDIKPLESGGAEVTVKLPDGNTITHPVVESKEEIEIRIAKCKDLDIKCQGFNHTC